MKNLILFGIACGLLSAFGTGNVVCLRGPAPLACQCAGLSPVTQEPVTELPRLVAPAEGRIPVAILVGSDAEVLDFCGPLEVFAGAYTADWNPLFAPYLVAATTDPVTVGGGMKVVPACSFANAPAPKIIVIPAMSEEAVTEEMLAWIRKSAATADLTMSVCNGSFVLARTGLLSGKKAAAHHGGYFRFAAEFPDVKLVRGARFTEDGKLACSGGVSSGIDLALRVVERYQGHQAAVQVADGIEYQGQGWLDAGSNSAFARMPAFDDEHPLCPLCLMQGERNISSVHNGKTYYFCHESEKEYFEKHRDVFDRFLREDLAQGK